MSVPGGAGAGLETDDGAADACRVLPLEALVDRYRTGEEVRGALRSRLRSATHDLQRRARLGRLGDLPRLEHRLGHGDGGDRARPAGIEGEMRDGLGYFGARQPVGHAAIDVEGE